MGTRRIAIGTVVVALLAIAACTTSPVDEQRKKDMEADIDEIMSYELDETEVGGPKFCLSDNEYRSFHALGDRHLLFKGRNDKQWVNVLRGRCQGLDKDGIFVMQQSTGGRLCDMDRFEVTKRFGSSVSTGMGVTCILGIFKPVVKAQVQEIETRLEIR